MSTADSRQDVWARLRALCRDGYRLPPVSEEQARDLERNHGILLSADECHEFTRVANGIMRRSETVCYSLATEEQLRATEEQLGFPLPADLRRLYSEIANGGLNLGIAHVFHGAIGGCGEYANVRSNGRTIEELKPHGTWRLHPRIEQALLRNPGYYVIADSSPDGFLWIAEDSEISIEIDVRTGYIFNTEYWGENPDAPRSEEDPLANTLISIELVAPSLAAWFESWLDESWGNHPRGGQLPPEMVETDDLPDTDIVWRGLYRFGPNWSPRSDDAEDDDSLSRYPLDG